LAPNGFWLSSEIKSALKGQSFQDIEDTPPKKDDDNESYSTTGFPKMFRTVATSLGKEQSCSKGVFRR
jgi:hypothetical protein